MDTYEVRIIGDPILRQRADEVTDIDSVVGRIVSRMIPTMHEACGIGLAAPQVGIQKRLFVWDLDDEPCVVVNPEIIESDGEWAFVEGCLSVPDLSWEIIRPKQVHMVGYDLEGNEVSIEADEMESRLFQHEIDHLNGVLLIDHLDEETRKAALRTIRKRGLGSPTQRNVA